MVPKVLPGIALMLLHFRLSQCKLFSFKTIARCNRVMWLLILATILQPEAGYVSTVGGVTSFTCLISGNASVQWLLNGSLIHTLNSSHAETTVDMSGGFTAGRLRLSNLPVTYNSTRITCVATLSATTPAQVLNATTSLLLQGRHQNKSLN